MDGAFHAKSESAPDYWGDTPVFPPKTATGTPRWPRGARVVREGHRTPQAESCVGARLLRCAEVVLLRKIWLA